MKSNVFVRSHVGRFLCIAATLAAPFTFGAAADRKQAQAQVLDHAEIPCANCFFGPSYHYYCFATDNKVLIGYQRTPVLNWRDTSKNYLTKPRKAWNIWTPAGETVPLSYDDKNIWVSRPDGKQVKLIQTYTHDVFSGDNRCRTVVQAKSE